ncbi:hypothetical protein ACFL38_04615 [Candidatus Omnitrophota bacterium]
MREASSPKPLLRLADENIHLPDPLSLFLLEARNFLECPYRFPEAEIGSKIELNLHLASQVAVEDLLIHPFQLLPAETLLRKRLFRLHLGE